MTATQMLTEGLNGVLKRPIVNGAELRQKLIKRGVIKPNGGWKLSTEVRWRAAVNGARFATTVKVLREVA